MYGSDVAFLLMYGSHDMRHTGFPQVDGGQWDPREWGVIGSEVKVGFRI